MVFTTQPFTLIGMQISLVIPAYNEAKRLPAFLQTIADYHHKNPDHLHEIIVIDDGSNDDTVASAKAFQHELPNFQLIEHGHNQGKGAAVRTGVLAAHGSHVVFTDADGATPITELPKMIASLQQDDIAIGNRWLPGAKTERHSLLRQLSGWVYRNYMKLFGLGAIDTMCGFKGYRADVAQNLFQNLQENRWLFDTEIAYKAVQAHYTIKNFPIEWESKDGSKLDSLTLLKSALNIYPLIRRLKSEPRPVTK